MIIERKYTLLELYLKLAKELVLDCLERYYVMYAVG
jgi:hypothetical protein